VSVCFLSFRIVSALISISSFFILKRWWKKHAVKLILRRNPEAKKTLKRFFVHQIFRLKYRNKIKSANLIITFLRESELISESMRKIYAFRQDVIKVQFLFFFSNSFLSFFILSPNQNRFNDTFAVGLMFNNIEFG
jgi:hypothetical protein